MKRNNANRPYVICHMMLSLDGKITGNFFSLPESQASGDFYDSQIRKLAPHAWGCGRTTFEDNYQSDLDSSLDLAPFARKDVGTADFIVKDSKMPYAVAFDRQGRLNWNKTLIEYPEGFYARILEVVTEKTRPGYLAYLRSMKIPYIVAGEDDLDLELFLEKLKRHYRISRFALCGGGNINAAFLKAGLVDEVSLVIAPVIEGTSHGLSFAEAGQEGGLGKAFRLKKNVRLPDGGLYLTYLAK
jgi:riboflavin biosynthesis pyrimidine reductase